MLIRTLHEPRCGGFFISGCCPHHIIGVMEDKVSAKLLVEIAESIKLIYPPKLENLDRLRALRHLVSFISVEQVAVISHPNLQPTLHKQYSKTLSASFSSINFKDTSSSILCMNIIIPPRYNLQNFI